MCFLTRDPCFRTPVLWPRLCVVGDAVGDTMTLTSLLTRCSALTSLSLTARDDIR